MATQEFIQKRIEGKKREIDKLEKKLARIMKAKESNWTDNPYYYHENDIKYTTRDIETAKTALAKYEQELIDTINKAASRNVPAITEFLGRWFERMSEYFENGLKEAYILYDRFRTQRDKCANSYGSPEYEENEKLSKEYHLEYYEALNGVYEEEKRDRYGIHRKKVRDGKLEYVKSYMGHNLEESMKRVIKDLTIERDNKYDFMLDRIIGITGKITDAKHLEIGAKGDLNGYIIGENGTANIKTIGAGGYNIQCFHFRTLIHKA